MTKEKELLQREEAAAVAVPDPPETSGALEYLPREVKAQWRKTWEQAFKSAQRQYPDNVEAQVASAYYEANKIFFVEEPKDHKDARQIPDWQVMRRQELPFKELPHHTQQQIRKEEGRASGMYLEVYAIDGRQYFFELPEGSAKPAGEKAEKKGAEKS